MFSEIRRNNPGNIRYNAANNWQGQTGQSGGFVVFSSLYYGIRAMLKIILNDIDAGTDTIAAIITQYAPPNENDTAGYIAYVANDTGINPNVSLYGNSTAIQSVVYSMIKMESGEAAPSILIATAYDNLTTAQPPQQYASNGAAWLIPAALAATLLIFYKP